MRDVKCYERLASQAIVQHSKKLAYEALAAHPLVGSWPLAKRLVAGYLEAHRETAGMWT